MMEKYYTVYKTTNIANGKIYIGTHVTNNLNDEYLGSGKVLLLAIEKYGKESFVREYIAIFDNPNSMFETESILVNDKFLQREDTYNLKAGGFGGWPQKEACHTRNVVNGDRNRKTASLHMKKMHAEGKVTYSHGNFKGRSHTKEAKERIGRKNSVRQKGSGNSQFGRIWICNEHKVKKIKKEDFAVFEKEGWKRGRKLIVEGE